MAGDVLYDKVSLLLHCDGANGSTSFIDSSPRPKTVTAFGNAQINTSSGAFGGAAALFDGSGDYLSVGDTPGLRSDGNITIEARICPSSVTGVHAIITKRSLSGDIEYQLLLNGNLLYLDVQYTGGVLSLTGTTALSVGERYHVAAVRSETTWKLFTEGMKEASGNVVGAYIGAPDPLLVGRHNTSLSWDFAGLIEEVRVTKAARYADNFTPPTAAFPDYAGQVSGVIRDDTGTPCTRAVRAYRRDTGALVGSANSDADTGAYTITCPTLDEVSRVVLDDAGGVQYNDLIDRVIPA